VLGEQEDDAGAERGSVGVQVLVCERQPGQVLGGDPRSAVAADERRAQAGGNAAGGVHERHE